MKVLFLLFCSQLKSLLGQQYFAGASYFQNAYYHFESETGVKSNPQFGFGLCVGWQHFADSVHPVFRNVQFGMNYFKGNLYAGYYGHYGTTDMKISSQQIMLWAGFHFFNLKLFNNTGRISFGILPGLYIWKHYSGLLRREKVKDTLGHTYGYAEEEKVKSNGKPYSRNFAFGLSLEYQQILTKTEYGSIMVGGFCHYFITTQFTGVEDMYPRQCGVMLRWQFKTKSPKIK